MDIQKLIETIQNAADTQVNKQDQLLVQQVLNLSNNEFEEKIINLRGTRCKSLCSAKIPKNTLFFKCFECSKDPTHVYCQECYIPDKHQNHVVTYHYSDGGCCDCGDIVNLIINYQFFIVNEEKTFLCKTFINSNLNTKS